MEGRLEAQIKALLNILAARGIHVDTATCVLIRHCRDQGQLDIWLAKAAVADRAKEIF